MALCEEIDYVVLYKERPLWSHGYILPFVMFYLSFAIGWLYTFNDDIYQHVELFFILLAAIGVLHVMTCLSCVWSVHVRCLLTCRRVLLRSATHVKVVPTPNNGHTQLVLLHREKGGDSEVTSFTFQNIKYINEGIGGAAGFKPIRFPVDHPLSSYISWKGYKDETDITTAKKTFGLNK
jgi:cation-transporting ATPase 13A1